MKCLEKFSLSGSTKQLLSEALELAEKKKPSSIITDSEFFQATRHWMRLSKHRRKMVKLLAR